MPFLKLSPTSIGIDDTGKDLVAFGALDDMVDNIINPHLIDLMMAKGTGAVNEDKLLFLDELGD